MFLKEVLFISGIAKLNVQHYYSNLHSHMILQKSF